LVLETGNGEVVFNAPAAYQQIADRKVPVRSGYKLKSGNQVGFELGMYDTSLPLVIDPQLDYSTYLGGNTFNATDDAYGLAVDSNGYAYVTGAAGSHNFPTTAGAYQTAHTLDDVLDIFVTKFKAD